MQSGAESLGLPLPDLELFSAKVKLWLYSGAIGITCLEL